MIAVFQATIVVEFEPGDDEPTAADDALNEYIANNDVSKAFVLVSTAVKESP